TANDGQLTTQSRTTTITVIPYGDYNSQIVASCKPEEGGKANGALCNVGDTVTVKAFANPGYRFMSWTENNIVVSKDSFYTFIVTGNRNLLANFRVNHAPVFVKEMSDTSILAGRTLPFTYKAIDPEGDSIKYSIFLKSELLMHIDSTSGFFVCRGQHTQVGKNYDLIIAATDGILTTLSKKAIISVYIIPSAQSEIFPTKFKLSQNYPNPFNPETTIEFTIPVVDANFASTTNHVTLKIYDVLGREVTTLVDEYKQPGNYKATFNARHLSTPLEMTSGVYFYQLRSWSIVETKKFVLMK
ncbi:MAG: T9SS type A sorting domain-containing protein, partial [Ignavibacteria bacterium]|nr:T9SS type A sorting domain-containing protein [Ignavibacteria bacterium]